MVMLSQAEENYLKCIFKKHERSRQSISTNAIADEMQTKASSVTDMLKRLAEKQLIHYKKYKGVRLTQEGENVAKDLVRRHRLWETFLVEQLEFTWDEVHEIAEQLEHVRSDKLTDRLDKFLGHPQFDPHGDPIPDKEGNIHRREQVPLTKLEAGESGYVTGVKDSAKEFLQYLDAQGIELGNRLEVLEIFDYDKSRTVKAGDKQFTLSQQVCNNLFVKAEI